MDADEALRYPIGKAVIEALMTPERRVELVGRIAELPAELRRACAGLEEAQLDTPYRPGGWTPRQVVHHVADSHMNAYLRFKLALTEEHPTIKPYAEDEWARLPDVALTPVADTLDLLDLLHRRWVALMQAMPGVAWQRTFLHPERGITFTLDAALCLYGWHGAHHTAHISGLRARQAW